MGWDGVKMEVTGDGLALLTDCCIGTSEEREVSGSETARFADRYNLDHPHLSLYTVDDNNNNTARD
jgi:hypothetical protein